MWSFHLFPSPVIVITVILSVFWTVQRYSEYVPGTTIWMHAPHVQSVSVLRVLQIFILRRARSFFSV
jgi:hypothetical protein